MTDHVELLKAKIGLSYEGSVTHLESVPIWEVFKSTSWEGDVEVFALDGSPKSDRRFAFWTDQAHEHDLDSCCYVPRAKVKLSCRGTTSDVY